MSEHFQPPTGATPVALSAASRVDALLARRTRATQIRLLADTRALHRLLSRLSQTRRPQGRAGRYRAPDETVYVHVNVRSVQPWVATTCPPDRVGFEMRQLSRRTHALLTDPPSATDRRRSELAAILATFFRIHPYRDGNGRTARILFRRAAALLDLPLNARWTLEPRGYGTGMSLAIDVFHLSPKLLETYLNRFFDD